MRLCSGLISVVCATFVLSVVSKSNLAWSNPTKSASTEKEKLGGPLFLGVGMGSPGIATFGVGIATTDSTRVLVETGFLGAQAVLVWSAGAHLQWSFACGRSLCFYTSLSTYGLFVYAAQIDADPGETCCASETDIGWGSGPLLGFEFNPWRGLQVGFEGGVLAGDWSAFSGLSINPWLAPQATLRIGYGW